jgi:hypothetical protein
MGICEHCGSIQVYRAPESVTGRFRAFITRRRLWLCRRCGWKGRRNWDENTRVDRSGLVVDSSSAYDPAMVVLDQGSSISLHQRKRHRRQESPDTDRVTSSPVSSEFDLPPLGELNAVETLNPHDATDGTPLVLAPRRLMSRRIYRARRNEIVGTVIVTAAVMLLVIVLGLLGSCSGRAEAL